MHLSYIYMCILEQRLSQLMWTTICGNYNLNIVIGIPLEKKKIF